MFNLPSMFPTSLVVLTIAIGLSSCSNQPVQTQSQLQTLSAPHYFQQANVNSHDFANRVTWGANKASEQQVRELGLDAYLLQQLRARQAQLPAQIQTQIDAMTISQKPFVEMMQALDQQREESAKMRGTDDSLRQAYQQELNRIAREVASRSVLRSIYSSNQLLEQMNWFWMNHFNISNRKDNLRAMLADFEENAIRPHALGNFRELLKATVLHPAMLRYLDNEHNAVNKINENYARELLELHTMGVGSGYTQADVQELARVLTGLGIRVKADNPRPNQAQLAGYQRFGLTEFHPRRHDFGEKKLLGATIKGQGLGEIDQVLDLLMRQPATAKFISQKLALFFVSDAPSDALVQSMADAFLQSKGDIPRVLRTMFESSEFVASLGKKFKDPMHYVISSVRLAYEDKMIVNTGPILNWINTLGQQANGHQTPDGYSMKEMAWSSPAQMTARFDVARLIARGAPNLFKTEMEETTAQHREAARPALAQNVYVKELSQQFSQSSRDALSQSGSAPEWNAFFLSTPEMMRR